MNKKYDDEHIEQLLCKLPVFRDSRSKDEIFARLKEDERIDSLVVKTSSNRWKMPMLATAAIFLVSFLTYQIIFEGNIESLTNFQSASEPAVEKAMNQVKDTSEMKEESASTLVTPANVEDQYIDTIAFEAVEKQYVPISLGVTQNAIVIPVTMMVGVEQIAEDSNALDLYEAFGAIFDEEHYGFDNYHPYVGAFTIQDETLRHVIPGDHPYDKGTASESVYFHSMSITFQDVERIEVVNEQGTEMEFAHSGAIPAFEPFFQKNKAVYQYVLPNDMTYFVPDGDSYKTVSEAIHQMTVPLNDLLVSPIPLKVDYSVNETDNLVTINFADAVQLKALTNKELGVMLEAFIYTVNNFEKNIAFNGLPFEQFGQINFTRPIPPVKGYNKIYLK